MKGGETLVVKRYHIDGARVSTIYNQLLQINEVTGVIMDDEKIDVNRRYTYAKHLSDHVKKITTELNQTVDNDEIIDDNQQEPKRPYRHRRRNRKPSSN